MKMGGREGEGDEGSTKVEEKGRMENIWGEGRCRKEIEE